MKHTGNLGSFGDRLKWLRQHNGMSLQQFGDRLGLGKSYLSKLESGKERNPSEMFLVAVASTFLVNLAWLRSGKRNPPVFGDDEATRISLPGWSEDRLGRVRAVLHDLPEALATDAVLGHLLRTQTLTELLAVWREIGSLPNLPAPARLFWNAAFTQLQFAKMDRRWKIGQEAERKGLTSYAEKLKTDGVQPIMPRLRERLRQQTSLRGSKTALAKVLGVPPQSVNDWLSGRKEPGGETTLRLLHWVEQEEAKQKAPDSVCSPPGETRSRKSKYEKPKSNPTEQ